MATHEKSTGNQAGGLMGRRLFGEQAKCPESEKKKKREIREWGGVGRGGQTNHQQNGQVDNTPFSAKK